MTTRKQRQLACRLLLASWLVFSWTPGVQAQFVQRQVGGVSIDANGVLKNISIDEQGALKREMEQALRAVPGDMAAPTELRKISLRQLEAAIAASRAAGVRLPDEIRYLAGLQRIRYVFAVPDQQDIILAGPAEGWRINNQGEVVGIKNGRPVMLLDDLLVALRSVDNARQGGISCSIDPTPDGLKRLQVLANQLAATVTPNEAAAAESAAAIEQTLGPEIISVNGVPATSHFARVIVAADYKMKRLALGFDAAPVKGMPSFLSMVKGGPRGANNMLPRFWLAANYQGVLASPDGMAYEIKGSAVKAMAEEDFLNADGSKGRTTKASPISRKWADSMTAHYEELAAKESIFGELRNCMDVAIVAALITKEHLADKAGYSMPGLLNAADLPTERYHAPQQVESIASMMLKGQKWVVITGGVQIDSWGPVMKIEPSDKLAPTRTAALADGKSWWWN